MKDDRLIIDDIYSVAVLFLNSNINLLKWRRLDR